MNFDDIDVKLEQAEVPAKRFGSIKADLFVRPMETGFSSFDRFPIIRYGCPDLCVIGARPGTGKTAFLVQVLRNIAVNEGPTLMFSLEMAHGQLALRAMAAESGIPTFKLKNLPEEKLLKIEEKLMSAPFSVDDSSGLDINTLRARAMDFKRRYGLVCIGVDYLQIIGADGATKRDQVGAVAKGLKQLGKDLNTPVIALAQMSREIEKRQQVSKSARPAMSDLQECSLVENWADQILFLDGAGKRDPARAGQVDVYLVKNRHGASGEFVLKFDGETTKFSDYEETSL